MVFSSVVSAAIRRPIPILMYHQVDEPPPSGTPMRGMVVAPQSFSRQMSALRILGYKGVSMRDLEPWLRGERHDRVVGITFDDGYKNNLIHALPVLQRNMFTATCYAVSNVLGGWNDWDAERGIPRKSLMNILDFKQWLRAGMDIGAHSRHHVDLTSVDENSARDEIIGSKIELESALGAEVRHFCYPYGHFQQHHSQIVAHAGYISATTVRRGRVFADDNLMALPRVLVAQSSHLGHFFAKIFTGYEDRYR
jgi:peptidoglycan/xylan/chitin deacetylase (PgdA/CDA1 family)